MVEKNLDVPAGHFPRRSFNRLIKKVRIARFAVFGRQPIILIELIQNPPHQIAVAHMVEAFRRQEAHRVVTYVDPAHTGLNRRQAFQQRARHWIRSLSSSNSESTFRAMGANQFIYPWFSAPQRKSASESARVFFESDPTKQDVEALRLDGILIGDLIYDDYLLKLRKGTVDPDSPQFREHLLESLKVFYFWKEFFQRHTVRGVIGNSVYRQALVSRIAIQHGCDVFDAQVDRIVRLIGDGYQFEDTKYYSQEFNSRPDRGELLEEAEQALSEKRRGKPDMSNSHLANPSGLRSAHRLLARSEKIKILIAPHCFSDSAHAFGPMLFSDFQGWLVFLAPIARDSKYEWYLKPHPRGVDDLPLITQIFAHCSNFTVLPYDASLSQLGEEGVSVALTMRGHVGFDFPLMGIPVISCTPGYRYRNYQFNLVPETTVEYANMLKDVESLPENIHENELAEFYYMDTILNHPNIIFPDSIGAKRQAKALASDGILGVFVDAVDIRFVEETVGQLQNFIESRELRFRRLLV